MTDAKKTTEKTKGEQAREERLAREAKALRANLLRRKQQQRGRPAEKE
ncbi:hypothetical protein [Saccharibacter floricola]|uniref:Uncharacterized protein n=1 Tax=Saccharibacter floricola DSM 15669 TaxID=1123227 RepID=A0ABQ0NY76_9PROT|nr:hypothetical protein [Saccharibacter floricola]GBQ06371.1 hypothetical protein AA15669_0906 [Saccharibacter floricola DSM 15669]